MWTAADSGDLATALIPAVWTFLGVVVVTLGTIAVQAQKSRSERANTTTSPSNGNGTAHLLQIAKDVGQLDQRANDNDERDDVQDRRHESTDDRLEFLERYNDHRDPDWRKR